MSTLEQLLGAWLAPAFASVAGERFDPGLRRSARADYQADGALKLAHRLRRDPRELAAEVVRRAGSTDLCSRVDVSGPGFIAVTVADAVLARLVATMAGDARLGVAPVADPQTVVVDYSSPNVAKELHVGHLRSTVIGDAAVRVLDRLGHRVVRANHLGDWGTPFGMLIEHLLDLGEASAVAQLSTGELNAFYRAARAKFDADAGFAERARRRVVALQSGDPATSRLWRLLTGESKKYFSTVYERLDVRLTDADFVGESSYNDALAAVVDELDERGLLRDSDGAKVVFPDGWTNRTGEPLPLIVRKSDGGYGYAATDLAAIRYRVGRLGVDRLLYVLGLPQRQHLAMVFQVAREAGWLTPQVRATHVAFGSVLGPDGRMLRTRSGEAVRLTDLLDEAVTRAAPLVAGDGGLDEATRAGIARAVGVGAVKYADLSTDRTRDYVFDWARMLSFDGNTAPYLQYAHARIRSIFRRGGVGAPADPTVVTIVDGAERALARELLDFPVVVAGLAESLEFHRLAGHLFAVASAFTGFYERCPVLPAEAATRASRLVLCDLTARVLAQGLELLGIAAPERM